MAGVWNSGEDFYSNDIYLSVSNSKHNKSWPINILDLHTVKLPILLCFELNPSENLIDAQCFYSLCAIGDRLLKAKNTKLEITTRNGKDPKTTKSLYKLDCQKNG